MFEYQYNDLITNNFRVIGITLRGFGKSDKPYGVYDYDIFAWDIKNVLSKLDVKDAVLVGFSMGGAIAVRYASADNGVHVSKLALVGAAAPIWTQRKDFPYNLPNIHKNPCPYYIPTYHMCIFLEITIHHQTSYL